MSIPKTQAPQASSADSFNQQLSDNKLSPDRAGWRFFFLSLGGYALAGAAAALLMSAIEWVDLSFQLSPVFASFSERLIFSAYFSINLLVGLFIGLGVGLFAHAAAFLKTTSAKVFARRGKAARARDLALGFGVAAVAAFLLNQQPRINAYIIGLIREAEKISFLNEPLLNHERAASYLLLMALVLACSAVWFVTLASKSMSRVLRAAWLIALAASIGAAYHVDSRVEAQGYEPSLHRSMFLLNMTLAMAIAGTVYLSSHPLRSKWSALKSPLRKSVAVAAGAIFVAALAFTFARFDKSQNLKTQVFYRTTQAKQTFQMVQWALDFDGDGYSSLLGGGDADDSRSDINPSQKEIPGDGIDNNCIGGELTEQAVEDWMRERNALLAAPNPSAQRFNVIWIFIDALRADHLSAYGYHRQTSPNIDKLAARSQVFDNAFAPSPNTFESSPKFMQSSYWDGHFKTWTEALAENGYNTFLFPRRQAMLRRYVKGIRTVRGGLRSLEQTVDTTIDALGNASAAQPFCAYVYAPDPHMPYKKHDKFYFGSSLTDLYDGEIAHTDAQLGRLFDWLERSGRINDTMIIIMADHGESLGERGVYKHSTQLYNEQIRVPMIVYAPNLAPHRISDYVSTIDLGSTILNTVGIAAPKEYAGVSLLPLMRGETLAHPPVFAEHTNKQESPFVRPDQAVHPESKKYMIVTQDGFKLIYNRNFYCFELYDLKNDPREQHNLYDRMPEKAAGLKKLLGQFIDIVSANRPPDADESKYSQGATDDNEEL